MIADVLDRLSSAADRAEGYPTWARALFAVTLALLILSVFVYALLYARVAVDDEGSRTGGGGS